MTQFVCITGMHRSGTSMVARALAAAGLWLGPPERLMPPQADNAEGFYESLDFVRFADELLDRLGGAWDCPPAPVRDAADADSVLLDPLRERARQLLVMLAADAPRDQAGWKDPRATLALPFWRRLVPGLRIVACVRDPLEVARSLQARNHVSLRYALTLWQAYNAALLDLAADEGVIVTHYDAWLADPATELSRVANAVGLALGEGALEAGVRSVRNVARPAARFAQAEDLLWGLGGAAAVATYSSLCARAGPVYRATPGARVSCAAANAAQQGGGAPPPRDMQILALQRRVGELGVELARLQSGAAPYRVGTVIDARKGGNAPLYLGQGWARAQDAGTWMLGTSAELVLPLHAAPEAGDLELQARVRPLLADGQSPLTATLQANDRVVATWSLGEVRPANVSCVLSPSIVALEQPLRLRFDVDRACAPSAVGLSADTRPLGLLLVSLSLRAAPPH